MILHQNGTIQQNKWFGKLLTEEDIKSILNNTMDWLKHDLH